jgi:hypothetical protein
MGAVTLDGMLEMSQDINVIMDWHLRYNCYPPHPEFADACIAAVDAINRDDWDDEIDLPEGKTTRDGRTTEKAYKLVECFHLDGFINQDMED